MARAWVFQDPKQRAKHGAKAKWSVGYIDPAGKRKQRTIGSKSMATKFARWAQRLAVEAPTMNSETQPDAEQDAQPVRFGMRHIFAARLLVCPLEVRRPAQPLAIVSGGQLRPITPTAAAASSIA